MSQQLESTIVEQEPGVIAPPREEIVQADNFMTLQQEPFTQVRPDKARTARHQHFHCITGCLYYTRRLTRYAAAGKYNAEDVRPGTYLSVIFLTTPRESATNFHLSRCKPILHLNKRGLAQSARYLIPVHQNLAILPEAAEGRHDVGETSRRYTGQKL